VENRKGVVSRPQGAVRGPAVKQRATRLFINTDYVKPEEMRAAKDQLNSESLQDSEKGREVFRQHGLALDCHRSRGKQGKGLEDPQIALSALFK
jgi:hypothetical protein